MAHATAYVVPLSSCKHYPSRLRSTRALRGAKLPTALQARGRYNGEPLGTVRLVTTGCLGPRNRPKQERKVGFLPAASVSSTKANGASTSEGTNTDKDTESPPVEKVEQSDVRKGPMVMPPKPILGVMPLEHIENQKSLTVKNLVSSDAVFNVELAWYVEV